MQDKPVVEIKVVHSVLVQELEGGVFRVEQEGKPGCDVDVRLVSSPGEAVAIVSDAFRKPRARRSDAGKPRQPKLQGELHMIDGKAQEG